MSSALVNCLWAIVLSVAFFCWFESNLISKIPIIRRYLTRLNFVDGSKGDGMLQDAKRKPLFILSSNSRRAVAERFNGLRATGPAAPSSGACTEKDGVKRISILIAYTPRYRKTF